MIKVGENFTNNIITLATIKPAYLRLIAGGGSLLTRPTVDYFTNKNLDEKTKKLSLAKAVSGIIIGTITGVFSRSIGFSIGEKLVTSGKIKIPNKIALGQFKNAVGNATAFIATLVTIILVDVPTITKSIELSLNKSKNSNKSDTLKVAGGK